MMKQVIRAIALFQKVRHEEKKTENPWLRIFFDFMRFYIYNLIPLIIQKSSNFQKFVEYSKG